MQPEGPPTAERQPWSIPASYHSAMLTRPSQFKSLAQVGTGLSTASTLRKEETTTPTKTVATSTHFDLLMVVWQDVPAPVWPLWVLS